MTRYLYWVFLVVIFLGQTPALAQIKQTEVPEERQNAHNPEALAQNLLQRIGFATMACDLDTEHPNRKCRVTEEHGEQIVLRELYAYGLRLDPEIGITLMQIEADKPGTYSLVAVAARNSIGAPVSIYIQPDMYSLVDIYAHSSIGEPRRRLYGPPLIVDALADGTGAFRVGQRQVPLSGTLNVYSFSPSPTEAAQISAPRQGLTYDVKTGLVTAAAP